jgi:ribosomal protein S9
LGAQRDARARRRSSDGVGVDVAVGGGVSVAWALRGVGASAKMTSGMPAVGLGAVMTVRTGWESGWSGGRRRTAVGEWWTWVGVAQLTSGLVGDGHEPALCRWVTAVGMAGHAVAPNRIVALAQKLSAEAVVVRGGGVAGNADAVRHSVAKAVVVESRRTPRPGGS